MVAYDNIDDKTKLISLWSHECMRVFADRLVDDNDRNWFFNLLGDYLRKTFEFDWEVNEFSNFLFGDYVNMNKEYCKIDNLETVPNKFNDYLMLYNA